MLKHSSLALPPPIEDHGHTVYSKHRLEALSDGIFAIVMTLLVLEIKPPAHVAHGELAGILAKSGRDWIALAMTFGLSSRFWVLQHQLFDLLEKIKPRTLLTTFIFLGLMTLLPYSTALWGHNIGEPLAVAIYFGHQGLIGVAMLVEIEFGLRDHNLHVVEAMYKLRGRLYIMIAAMSAACLAVWLLPLEYTGITAAGAAVVGRIIRNFLDKRRAKKHAHTAAA
jgi:uncharacterized membrane protein